MRLDSARSHAGNEHFSCPSGILRMLGSLLIRELEPKQHATFFTTFVCTANSHTMMLSHLVNAL
jgi:hypothetical protein